MSSRDPKPQETSKTPTTASSESKREVASNLDQDREELLSWKIDKIKKLVKDRWKDTLSEFLRSINYSINDIPYDDKEKDKEKLVSYYARMGDGETVQWLIEHFQADVSLALYSAACGGQAKLVQDLAPEQGDRETFFGNAVEAHQRGEIDTKVVEYLRKVWDISVKDGIIYAMMASDGKLLDHLIKTYGEVYDGENLLSTAINHCSNRMLMHVLIGNNPHFRREAIIRATNLYYGGLAAELINDSVIPYGIDTAPINVDALLVEVVDIIVRKLKLQHKFFTVKALNFLHELLSGLDERFGAIFFAKINERIKNEFQSPKELQFPIDAAAIYLNARNIRDVMRVTKMNFQQASIWVRPEMQSFFSQSVLAGLQNSKSVSKDNLFLIAQKLAPLSLADFEFFWKYVSFERLRDKLVKLLRFHAEKIKTSETLPANTIAWKLADRYAAIGNRQDLVVALEKDLVSVTIDVGSRKIIDKYLQQLNGATSTLASSQSSSGGIPEDDKSHPYSTQPVDDSSVAFSGFTVDSKGVEADERLRQQFLTANQDGTGSVEGDVAEREQKQSAAPLPGTKNVPIPTTHSTFHASSNTDTGYPASTSTTTVSPAGSLSDTTPPTPRDETTVAPDTAAAQQQGQSKS